MIPWLMVVLILAIIAILIVPTEAAKKRKRPIILQEWTYLAEYIPFYQPTDMDWNFGETNGLYQASWPEERMDSPAYITGPAFPRGVRVLIDNPNTYKQDIAHIVRALNATQ